MQSERLLLNATRILSAVLVGAWVTVAALGQVPCRYQISHTIQGPDCPSGGSSMTVATAMSPSGRYVVGYYRQCGSGENKAFIYDTSNQTFEVIPMPVGIYAATASDVNDTAVVVGTSERTSIGQRGFVYQLATGQWTELLPQPGGVWSAATAINSSNVVCGWRSIGPGTNPTTAFRWSVATGFEDVGLVNGLSTAANDISESNVVVGGSGTYILNTNYRAIIFDGTTLQVLDPVPGGITSDASAITPTGEILVWGLLNLSPTYEARTFLLKDKEYHALAVPDGCYRTRAVRINSVLTSVGACNDLPTATWRGAIWQGTNGQVLNTLIDPSSGFYVRTAVGVSEEGLIACEVYDLTFDTMSVVLSPIAPKPGDTNCDERVNVPDLLNVINAWGPCDACNTDFNGDQHVNIVDLIVVIEHWGDSS